jgi:hypothetical protein
VTAGAPGRAAFRRVVAVDWSGAATPGAQRRGIRVCVVDVEPAGLRVVELSGGRDRAATLAHVRARVAGGGLVGLDFPFAYPAPFLDRLGVRTHAGLLRRLAREARDPAGFVERVVGPWWARWARAPDRVRRLAERQPATAGTESPLRALPRGAGWGFVGPRQVGLAAVHGLAALAAWRAADPGLRLWPFEDPRGARVLAAEVWPRLALGARVKRDPAGRRAAVAALARRVRLPAAVRREAAASADACDALAAAVALAAAQAGPGPTPWRPGAPSALPEAARREGWILGVPPPAPHPRAAGPRVPARSTPWTPSRPTSTTPSAGPGAPSWTAPSARLPCGCRAPCGASAARSSARAPCRASTRS